MAKLGFSGCRKARPYGKNLPEMGQNGEPQSRFHEEYRIVASRLQVRHCTKPCLNIAPRPPPPQAPMLQSSNF
ncbi:hypothetical protein [Paracoccus halophilus]|uniref:hypothetical protein n=1 Tax=Paracoccus halophilus TaxID=376733 RepID=UPI000A4B3090|nr:hypothetical protein [Paracoccus halophilus]